MLEVRDLSVTYGQHRALENVSVRVNPKEIVVILGANGAGKSTLLRTISGICEGQHSGVVEMEGHAILGLGSDEIVERGVALVPEGRGIFGDLTVMENLLLGAYSRRARGRREGQSRSRVEPVSEAGGTQGPDRAHNVRRGAADGCDRPGDDVQPADP